MSYKSKRAHRKNQQTRNFVPKGGDFYCAVYFPGSEAAIQAGMQKLGVDRKRFTDDLCDLFRANGGGIFGMGMACCHYADPTAPHMVLQLVSLGPMAICFHMIDGNDVSAGQVLFTEAA
jgi:hypothetical protein